jgi:hypothetical protein
VRRWRAFNVVCAELRAGLLGDLCFEKLPPVSWELLIESSSHHNVTPALSWCLKDKAVPPDIRSYFDAILCLNRTRNGGIVDGLARVVTALNAIEIEPVLLKGVSHLIEDLYPAQGLRVVGDIDVLMPDGRANDAAAALQRVGFSVSKYHLESHLHLPVLRDNETGLCVELHTRVEVKEAVIPTAWFRERTCPFPFRGLKLRVPEPTASIGLNIVHSQLNHEGYQTSGIELRQLLDLAMIRARHESAIDWFELDHRFGAAGFGHVLASYLKFAEVFFGQTAPRLSNLPRKLALERLRVFVEWPDRAKRRAAYITLTEENQALRSQLDALQQQLASVYSSTSWKISSPLRKVRQLIQLPRFGGPRRKAASCRSPASA